jgi:hypothetical protein
MNYKTILVHVDCGKRTAVCIEVAILMAIQHEAHLVALYTQEPFVIPAYLTQAGQEIGEAQKKFAAEKMARTKAVFNNQASSMGFKNTEWRSTINFPVVAVAKQAR